MGWCGSMSHGFVRGERIRHVAWRAAEDSNRRQAGAVHGDRLHVVIVLRTVRFVRHAVERLDRPAHTGAESRIGGR